MTTDEMIEVMAQSLWEAQSDHWGKYRDYIPELVAWDDLTHSKRNELKREARAALAAILPVLWDDIGVICLGDGNFKRSNRGFAYVDIYNRFDEIAKEINNAKLP